MFQIAIPSLPLDDELGLGPAQMTPAVADLVEMMGVVASFESAARLLHRTLGIEMSGERVRRSTESAGQRCLKADEEEALHSLAVPDVSLAAPPVDGDRRYLMADGGMVPTVEGFREAKMGVCFRASDQVELSPTRAMLAHKRFFGDLVTAREFGQRLYATARREGVASDGAGCDVLGDGAPWIWNLKAEHLPAAGETVDWYHAKEHIFETAHALYGEGTRKATAWAEARADELWAEKPTALLGALHRLRPGRKEARESVDDLQRYVTTNQCRMQYASRRRRGLLVGSGPIEGGISYVLQGRLKRCGMRWSPTGARQVLALRLRWANNEWDHPGARPPPRSVRITAAA